MKGWTQACCRDYSINLVKKDFLYTNHEEVIIKEQLALIEPDSRVPNEFPNFFLKVSLLLANRGLPKLYQKRLKILLIWISRLRNNFSCHLLNFSPCFNWKIWRFEVGRWALDPLLVLGELRYFVRIYGFMINVSFFFAWVRRDSLTYKLFEIIKKSLWLFFREETFFHDGLKIGRSTSIISIWKPSDITMYNILHGQDFVVWKPCESHSLHDVNFQRLNCQKFW